MKLRFILLSAALALFSAHSAIHAQVAPGVATVVANCGTPPSTYSAGTNRALLQNTAGNACTAASVSASITGFEPATTGTAISVTTGGNTGTLPAGTVVVASNIGTTNNAYCKLGASATVADQLIAPNSWFAFTVGAATQLTCITASSTTTINMVGGSGLPTGAGGGGGGSGSNAAASATGSSVPSSASYNGLNVGGTLRGQTAVNPTGSVYAAQSDISSVAGTTVSTGAGAVGSGTARVAVGQDTTTVAGAAPTTTGIYVTGPSAAALATAANQAAVQGSKAGGTAATNSDLVGGVYNTSAPTLTNGQQAAAQLDSSGNLKVNIVTGASSGAVSQGSTTSGQSVVPMGCRTLTSAPTDTTAQTNMPSCDTAGALRVNVTSATGVAQGSTSSGQTISPIGCRTLTSAPTDTTAQTNMPWCSTKGSLVVAQPTAADLNATVVGTGTFATQSTLVGATTGGATSYGLQSAASTNSTSVKGSAGTLVGMNLINTTTTIYYLRMYNASSAPTCSSATNFVRTWPIPPAAASGQAGGIAASLPVQGVAFSTGIAFCLTGGPTSTDNTNAATGVFVNLDYF